MFFYSRDVWSIAKINNICTKFVLGESSLDISLASNYSATFGISQQSHLDILYIMGF
jgi:hypothetical protein